MESESDKGAVRITDMSCLRCKDQGEFWFWSWDKVNATRVIGPESCSVDSSLLWICIVVKYLLISPSCCGLLFTSITGNTCGHHHGVSFFRHFMIYVTILQYQQLLITSHQ